MQNENAHIDPNVNKALVVPFHLDYIFRTHPTLKDAYFMAA